MKRTDAKLYKLLVQHRFEETHAKLEDIRSKIVPIMNDKRPEARALLQKVQLGGFSIAV